MKLLWIWQSGWERSSSTGMRTWRFIWLETSLSWRRRGKSRMRGLCSLLICMGFRWCLRHLRRLGRMWRRSFLLLGRKSSCRLRKKKRYSSRKRSQVTSRRERKCNKRIVRTVKSLTQRKEPQQITKRNRVDVVENEIFKIYCLE